MLTVESILEGCTYEQWKNACALIKEAMKKEAVIGAAYRAWERLPPNSQPVQCPPIPGYMRATLLCMALTHKKGKLHCRTIYKHKQGHRVDFSTLADQREFFEKHTEPSKWSGYHRLSPEERAAARLLIAYGDAGEKTREVHEALTIEFPADTVAA